MSHLHCLPRQVPGSVVKWYFFVEAIFSFAGESQPLLEIAARHTLAMTSSDYGTS